MFIAPGPMEAVTASVARRRACLAYPAARWTSACSLRPWTKGITSENWSSACPSPATLPCPKIPSVAGMRRRRSPSASVYWCDRYLTMAWATVIRTTGMDPPSPGTAVQDDGLGFGHLRHRGAWTFLAQAAALQPAVRHQVGAPQWGPVDVDVPGVNLADCPDGPADVAGEDARRQAVRGAVGLCDRRWPVFRGADRHRRSEQLILAQRRGRVDVGDHRRRDARAVTVAAGEQPGAAGDRRGDGRADSFRLAGVDQRPHAGLRRRRVSGADGLHLGYQRVEEVRADRRVGDDALHRDADLTGVDVATRGHRGRGRLQVGVGQDHHGAGRAQFQGQPLDPGDPADVLTGRRGTGEGDLPDPGIGN